jgi:hypothetical protein
MNSLNGRAGEGMVAELINTAELVDGARDDGSDGAGERLDDQPRRRLNQTELLITLAKEASLFRTPDRTAYADIVVDGHRETWPLRSSGFRLWVRGRYYEATAGAPSSVALQSAIDTLEAKAVFSGPCRDVFTRLGSVDGRLYLDLVDDDWRVVEIDRAGWRVLDRAPTRFRRAAGMIALPAPQTGGSIDLLRQFINVKADGDFVLVVAWLLTCLRGGHSYPLLAISGEQGSAKSTFTGILRALTDPNHAPLRALPKDDRDLFIAASNAHVLAFDNVSGLPPLIADTLCRLSTGGGFATRQLYTDGDEVLFEASRPIILNGIEDVVSRPDLADRAVFLTLEPIPERRRRAESELWGAFELERPRILGALLDAVATGLAREGSVKLKGLPRMADFALWATACEGALWPQGTFSSAYGGNRAEAAEGVIDGDPVATAVRRLAAAKTTWSGTASELLKVLEEGQTEHLGKIKSWPTDARVLSGKVRRAATALRKAGVDVTYARSGHRGTRIIQVETMTEVKQPEELPTEASASSASSVPPLQSLPSTASEPAEALTQERSGADATLRTEFASVVSNVRNPSAADAADDADAAITASSEDRRDIDQWVEIEERAAIVEFDGGLSRVEAEKLAFLVTPPSVTAGVEQMSGAANAKESVVGFDGWDAPRATSYHSPKARP